MEFDIKTLKPTFRFDHGTAGRSNGIADRRRLGLPQQILDFARRQIDPAHLKTDDLLDEIHHQRDLARQDRQASCCSPDRRLSPWQSSWLKGWK